MKNNCLPPKLEGAEERDQVLDAGCEEGRDEGGTPKLGFESARYKEVPKKKS
jgi:hypothetical protein